MLRCYKEFMENVVIWGCRDGEYLYSEILNKASDKYNVVCFGDNNLKYNNIEILGKPVLNMRSIVDLYNNHMFDKVIVAVRKGYSRYCIIKQLKDNGIFEILLVKPFVLTYRQPIVFDEFEELYNMQWLDLKCVEKPIIHHLEINIADGCNLNCRGCLHFSNLYAKDEFPDQTILLNTIAKISQNAEIFQFRVLGGEPLLCDNLAEFLVSLRKLLPTTDLAVISNGILIPRYDEKLYHIMNENYIGFNLTLYEPTLKMKDKIYDTLKKHNVAYGSHESKCEKFEKFIRLIPGSSKAFETCEPRGILVVKDDKLYRCPIEAYIDKFYEKYDIDNKAPEGIDVLDGELEWDKLISDLYEKPRPLCTYCSEKSEFYEWSNGKPEMEDWIVEWS